MLKYFVTYLLSNIFLSSSVWHSLWLTCFLTSIVLTCLVVIITTTLTSHCTLSITTSYHLVYKTIMFSRSRVQSSILAVVWSEITILRIQSKFELSYQANQQSTTAAHLKTYHLLSINGDGGGSICMVACQAGHDVQCTTQKRFICDCGVSFVLIECQPFELYNGSDLKCVQLCTIPFMLNAVAHCCSALLIFSVPRRMLERAVMKPRRTTQ